MGLAAIAQVLELIDPIIFGKIIDNFAVNTGGRSENELVSGVLRLLALAVGIALLARMAQAFTDYVTRLVVQKFGLSIFDEGLKHTLRLPFHEFEETSSGHVLSVLQKVRNDNERFISSFINSLFSAVVGVAFLIWYAITKHWALIPVFLIGVVVLGGRNRFLRQRGRFLRQRRSDTANGRENHDCDDTERESGHSHLHGPRRRCSTTATRLRAPSSVRRPPG